MPDTKIFEGKTTNEAIEKGLKELKVSKNDVEINVLKEDSKKSFFDILAPRVVKVEMRIKEKKEEKTQVSKKEKKNDTEVVKIEVAILEEAKNKIDNFLNKFLEETSGNKVEYKSNIKENALEVIIDDKNVDFLIGYRGETLNSLQTILSTIASSGNSEKIRVELDVLGYREKRKKVLEDLAEKIAKSVIRTRKPITLEPMTPYERKIIHSKLQDNSKVKTVSVGEGNHRKVVISLK